MSTQLRGDNSQDIISVHRAIQVSRGDPDSSPLTLDQKDSWSQRPWSCDVELVSGDALIRADGLASDMDLPTIISNTTWLSSQCDRGSICHTAGSLPIAFENGGQRNGFGIFVHSPLPLSGDDHGNANAAGLRRLYIDTAKEEITATVCMGARVLFGPSPTDNNGRIGELATTMMDDDNHPAHLDDATLATLSSKLHNDPVRRRIWRRVSHFVDVLARVDTSAALDFYAVFPYISYRRKLNYDPSLPSLASLPSATMERYDWELNTYFARMDTFWRLTGVSFEKVTTDGSSFTGYRDQCQSSMSTICHASSSNVNWKKRKAEDRREEAIASQVLVKRVRFSDDLESLDERPRTTILAAKIPLLVTEPSIEEAAPVIEPPAEILPTFTGTFLNVPDPRGRSTMSLTPSDAGDSATPALSDQAYSELAVLETQIQLARESASQLVRSRAAAIIADCTQEQLDRRLILAKARHYVVTTQVKALAAEVEMLKKVPQAQVRDTALAADKRVEKQRSIDGLTKSIKERTAELEGLLVKRGNVKMGF